MCRSGAIASRLAWNWKATPSCRFQLLQAGTPSRANILLPHSSLFASRGRASCRSSPGSEIGANVAVLLNDGVRGIISNGTTLKTALHAVRLVQSGGTFVSPELLSNGEHRTEFGGLLTQRQIDVVEALRQGKANKEIARDLNLRESTVKVHIRQIMRKLDAKNRTEIAVLANELREISRNSDHEEQG
jgi:DNA-binding CsgD family transcriptional regulator